MRDQDCGRSQNSSTSLRPAVESDRRKAWEWLARSDVTPSMIGRPIIGTTPYPPCHAVSS